MSDQITDIYALSQQDFHELALKIAENPSLVSIQDTNKRTLLHWSALGGRNQLLEHLLTFPGVSVSLLDETYATPLILATLGGHFTTVKILHERGADINHQNWQGHSALQYACSKGWKDIVEYLLANGADVNITDKLYDTPLHRIASQGRVEILQILLKHSIKPILDAQNEGGNTPLHIACEDDNGACAIILIENGASMYIKNKKDKTPLDLCKTGLKKQIENKFNIKA